MTRRLYGAAQLHGLLVGLVAALIGLALELALAGSRSPGVGLLLGLL